MAHKDAAAGWVGGGPAAADAPGDEGAGAYFNAAVAAAKPEVVLPVLSLEQRDQISCDATERENDCCRYDEAEAHHGRAPKNPKAKPPFDRVRQA
jgi:hypothetical protein